MSEAVAIREAAPTEARRPRERLLDIERGKGLGILLVVYGHLVMAGTLGEPAWYAWTKSAVYLFHMPFFMYLSGFVYFHTGAHLALERKFGKFFQARLDRLLVPFIALSLIVVAAKLAAGLFTDIDDGVDDLVGGLWAVLSNSPGNPSISVWYLLVLFVYSVTTPLLWRLSGRRLPLLLALALLVHFLPVGEGFYLGRILRFFVFFVLGMAAARYAPMVMRAYRLSIPLTAIVLTVLLIVRPPFALLWCGTVSIPLLHGIISLPIFSNDRILLWFGENSMVIYLFNTLAIGFAKAIYVRILPYDGAWFAMMILVLMAFGALAPVLLKVIVGRIPMAAPVYKYIQ